jgi:cytochrome c-type biogenesis protein CcmH/NrfG
MARRADVFAALAIIIIVASTYSGSFDGDFISDDISHVRDNPLIRSLAVANIQEIFTTFDGSNYMPLKVLSLAVDYQLWGSGPAGFHATNLALHIGCALVVYSILSGMGLPRSAACLTALLWAVHPQQVESVAWISERKNVLSGLFFFSAFRVYLVFSKRPSALCYVGFLLLYVLALLSKMNTMVLPALCLAYEATFCRRLRRSDWLAQAPLFGLAAFAAWYNLAGNPIHGSGYHGGGPIVTWLTSSVVIWDYIGRMIVPIDLRPRYVVMLRGSPWEPAVLLSLLGLGAVAVAVVWLWRACRREAFWLLWFGITLAPMLNIVPFRSLMNDRYMYLALLGPLAFAATVWAAAGSKRMRQVGVAVGVVLTLAWAGLSLRQVEIWSTPLTHWLRGAETTILAAGVPGFHDPLREAKIAALSSALGDAPESARLHNNLGAIYYESRRFAEAQEAFETANGLRGDDPTILLNLALVRIAARSLEEAQVLLERSIFLYPYSHVPYLYLTRVHLARGNASGAREALDNCVRLQPGVRVRRERAALARLEAARGRP